MVSDRLRDQQPIKRISMVVWQMTHCGCMRVRHGKLAKACGGYSPMSAYIPERAMPELLALQAKLSAQMPYRRVVATLREFLPVDSKLNHVTVRNRALRVGIRIDGAEVHVGGVAEDVDWTLAIDGGFV